jgi:hypothetical protein
VPFYILLTLRELSFSGNSKISSQKKRIIVSLNDKISEICHPFSLGSA